jgi:pimeloyl-ACP methyl ester carboxylesterase
MILRTKTCIQHTTRNDRITLIKDVVMTGDSSLGMVRKRLPPPRQPKGVVLLIHGFGQNRYTWHTSKRSFSAFLVKKGWEVFSVDLRGHGRSRRFAGSIPLSLDDYISEDLPSCFQEIERLTGQKKIVLVGHSMGGMISYAAASTSLRDKVNGIITIGSPYRFGLGNNTIQRLAKVLHLLRLTGILDSNPSIPVRSFGRQVRKFRKLFDSKALPVSLRGWRPKSIEPEILDEYLERSFEPTNIQITLDLMTGADRVALSNPGGRIDYGVAFESLRLPLLVISGSQDSLAPPASVQKGFLRSRSENKTYRSFPLGHADLILGREATTTVWPLISDWLESNCLS